MKVFADLHLTIVNDGNVTQKELAEEFKVSQPYIGQIVRNRVRKIG